jgi:hypothetical protein
MSLKLDLLAILLLVGLEPPTQAHDIYSHLTDSSGKSCCDEKDCRPVSYRVSPAGVQMFVDGEWIVVPDHTIQYQALPGDTGETAGGHWCGDLRNWHTDGVDYRTQCAILPPNSAMLLHLLAE